jgi:hypothetical protein
MNREDVFIISKNIYRQTQMFSSKPNILSQCQFNARGVFQYPTYIPITSSNQDVFSITNIFTYTIIYSNHRVSHRLYAHVCYLEQHHVSHRLYAHVFYLEQHHGVDICLILKKHLGSRIVMYSNICF